ncbi:PREDICTED: zinc finger protein interacting with ribonucleoprotein K-like [Polistes dominula]|uniref:Zinc finger protein interacting with ribonucleoprotein K-like n=1 Tax=Polistes dominula TaxID=743375 RepID=A0ABM1IEF5_POLDO|nr:PREDICTED: zinc finger protein interacting with ribonucleoprotein K-like [Polistes dominula]
MIRMRDFYEHTPKSSESVLLLQLPSSTSTLCATSTYSSSNWTVPTLPTSSRVAMYTTRCLRSMTMTDDHERTTGVWGSRKYICNDCQTTFTLKASLVRHKTFECNNKQQNYHRQGTTNNQKVIISNQSCTTTLTGVSIKTTTIATAPSMADILVGKKRSTSRHVCSKCHKSYAFFTSLWRHQNYECGIEPQFNCPICAAKFAQKSNLDRHVKHKH